MPTHRKIEQALAQHKITGFICVLPLPDSFRVQHRFDRAMIDGKIWSSMIFEEIHDTLKTVASPADVLWESFDDVAYGQKSATIKTEQGKSRFMAGVVAKQKLLTVFTEQEIEELTKNDQPVLEVVPDVPKDNVIDMGGIQ